MAHRIVCGPARYYFGSAAAFIASSPWVAQAQAGNNSGSAIVNGGMAAGILMALGGIYKTYAELKRDDQKKTIADMAKSNSEMVKSNEELKARIAREEQQRAAHDLKVAQELVKAKEQADRERQEARDRLQELEFDKKWLRIQLARRADIVIPPAPPANSEMAKKALSASGVFAASMADGVMGKVLIVEDERTEADRIQKVLMAEGWKTSIAYSGEEAMVAIKEDKPDFVMLDLGLPDCDGIDFLCKAKSDRSLRDIRFVVATGTTSAEKKDAARRCGAASIFEKPYPADLLLEWLAEAMLKSWPPPV